MIAAPRWRARLMLALAFIVQNGDIADRYRETELARYVSLGLFNIVIVIGLTSWVTLCRLVRAEVKKVRELESLSNGDAADSG